MKILAFVRCVFIATTFGTAGELRAQSPAAPDFTGLDTLLFAKFDDGDDTLSKDEVGAYPWARYDADDDGSVSKQEFLLGRLKDRLMASLEPNAEKAFALLDWTKDGKLSGAELDGGVWLSFDGNSDKIVEKAEYFAAKAAAPGNVPGIPATDAPIVWKKYTAGILAFEMPGSVKKIRDDSQVVEFGADLDGGAAVYRVVVQELGSEKINTEALLAQLNDQIIEQLKGEVVGNDKIELGGYPGRDLRVGIPEKFRFRQQAFIVKSRLVQAFVRATPQSKVTPNDVQRFFASLKFGPADSAVPATAVASVTHAMFVDALAAKDERAIHAMMHAQIQSKINPAILQMYFDIVKEQMGPVQAKNAEAAELKSETLAGVEYVHGKSTVNYTNGPVAVTTSVAQGKLTSFLLEAPQITPEAIQKLNYVYLSKLDDESQDFAEQFQPACEKFVRTLFDTGAEQAFALLDPRIQAGLRKKGEPALLEKIRKELGPVEKMEVLTFRFEGTPTKGLEEFIIGFEGTRSGGKPLTIEFAFAIDGLNAVVIGYEFREAESTESDAPAPPAGIAPGAGRSISPRTSITPPAASADDVPPPPAPPRKSYSAPPAPSERSAPPSP